jgi:hypothetical protein
MILTFRADLSWSKWHCVKRPVCACLLSRFEPTHPRRMRVSIFTRSSNEKTRVCIDKCLLRTAFQLVELFHTYNRKTPWHCSSSDSIASEILCMNKLVGIPLCCLKENASERLNVHWNHIVIVPIGFVRAALLAPKGSSVRRTLQASAFGRLQSSGQKKIYSFVFRSPWVPPSIAQFLQSLPDMRASLIILNAQHEYVKTSISLEETVLLSPQHLITETSDE